MNRTTAKKYQKMASRATAINYQGMTNLKYGVNRQSPVAQT